MINGMVVHTDNVWFANELYSQIIDLDYNYY